MKILLLLLISLNVFAEGVNIRLEPKNPVVGESYEVIFEVSVKEENDPVISFKPYNLEVISKEQRGTSTRASYINGKVEREKTITVAYEVISKRAGIAQLRSIVVEADGQKSKYRTYKIKVLKTHKRASNLFAMAVVDKTNAYVGESILVRYYNYHRVNANTAQVLKFPVLKGFLKRYHQEKSVNERVTYEGLAYTRTLIYTAQLFPNKPGKLKIDPITVKVNYSTGSSPFGGFGGFSRMRSKSLKSEPVEINVLPVPVEGMPKSFSGLVGEHTFDLETGRTKFLANEPIELKLKVKGQGALELFEAPSLIMSNKVEEFEKTATLEIESDFTARKSVQYTYLGRENGIIPAQEIEISYFDPKSKQFKVEKLKVSEIKIAGAKTVTEIESKQSPGVLKSKEKEFSKPNYDLSPLYKVNNSIIYYKSDLIKAFALLTLLVLGFKLFGFLKSHRSIVDEDLYLKLKKGGVDYGELFKVTDRLSKKGSATEKIMTSSLKSRTKKNLINILTKCESDFKVGKKTKYKLDRKSLEDLIIVIRNNESI